MKLYICGYKGSFYNYGKIKKIIDYINNIYEQYYFECIENALCDIILLTLKNK